MEERFFLYRVDVYRAGFSIYEAVERAVLIYSGPALAAPAFFENASVRAKLTLYLLGHTYSIKLPVLSSPVRDRPGKEEIAALGSQ
jgi:hypothetical protein